MNTISKVLTVGAASLILAAGTLIAAGPLNPPAGPVTSTYKTLSDVEPRIAISLSSTPGDADSVYKITQPGSYYLMGNVSVGSGKYGIEIAADRVTVDLNGFSVTGTTDSYDGVSVAGVNRQMVTVRNGFVSNMGDAGVKLYAAGNGNSRGHQIENVSVRACETGILIDSGSIRNCIVSENKFSGIYAYGWVDGGVLIDSCAATLNGDDGISVGNGTIRDSVARSNGSTGIRIGNAGLIEACHSEQNEWGFGGANFHLVNSIAVDNTIGGVFANVGSTIRANYIVASSLENGSTGITISNGGSIVENNAIVRYSTAIKVGGVNNFVIRNSISACPTAMNSVAGNRIGTIVVGTSSQAINGNSGGGLGTTDPSANVLF